MQKIINFKTTDEFRKYVDLVSLKEIGSGSEGYAYLTKDKKVIKSYLDGYDNVERDYKKIITSDDFKLNSFIFPDKLYLVDDKIVGYISKYFSNDIFNNDYIDKKINLNKIAYAREKMLDDIATLNYNKIYLFELCFNLLFDGKKMVAIDTLDYYKDLNISLDKLIIENTKTLDYAITTVLSCILDIKEISTEISFDEYRKELKKIYKKDEIFIPQKYDF